MDIDINGWKRHIQCNRKKKIDFYAKCYEYFAEDKEPFAPLGETLNLMRLIQQMHAEQEQ